MAKMQMVVVQVAGAGEDLIAVFREAVAKLESGGPVVTEAAGTVAQKKTAASTVGSRRRGSGRESLWQWLQARPEPPRWRDIVASGIVPTGSLGGYLQSLIAECRVRKHPDGRYEVLDDSPNTSPTSTA